MLIRELITKLGFNVDDKGLKQYDSKIDKVKSSILSINTLLASAAVVGFGALVKSSVAYGSELLKSSQITGIAVDALEDLRFAAAMADVSQGTLGSALNIFSSKLEEAKTGSEEAIESFKKIGIDPKQIHSAEQGLDLIGKRLAKLPDGYKKIALAREVFGRSGAELIPIFNDENKEIEKFGKYLRTYGPKDLKKFTQDVDDLGDTFDTLLIVSTRIKNQFVGGLTPSLTRLAESFLKLTASLGLAGNSFVDLAAKALSYVFDGLAFSIEKISEGINFLTKNIRFLFSNKTLTPAILILGTLVSMGLWLPKLVAGFKLLGAAIAFALSMSGIGLAIAGLGAVLVIIDDIRAFFNGELSVTKTILNYSKLWAYLFREMFDRGTQKFGELWEWIKQTSANSIDWIVEYFGNKLNEIKGFFTDILPEMPPTVYDAIDAVKKSREKLGDVSSNAAKINQAFPSFSVPVQSQLASAGGSVSSTSSNNVNLNQSISVQVDASGINSSPEKLGEEIKRQIAMQTEREYREAFSTLQGLEARV